MKKNKNKYKILFDYRSEGFQFQNEEFNTVAEAVKHAINLNYSSPFLIVQVVDWEAVEIKGIPPEITLNK